MRPNAAAGAATGPSEQAEGTRYSTDFAPIRNRRLHLPLNRRPSRAARAPLLPTSYGYVYGAWRPSGIPSAQNALRKIVQAIRNVIENGIISETTVPIPALFT